MADTVDVSVVIPTFGRRDILRRTLALYDAQGPMAGRFEAIVVDDGSSDGTPEMVERLAPGLSYPLKLIPMAANSGPSAARNRAIAAARGTVLLITGDDILPEPDMLEQHWLWHAERFPQKSVGVLGRVRWADEPAPTKLMAWLEGTGGQFGYDLIAHGEAVDFGFLYTSNVSVKRAFLAETGEAFDERLRFCEDSEWGERLFAHGFELRYNANAIGRHLHPTTLDGSLRRMEEIGRAGRLIREVSPANFARLTHGLFEPANRGKLALLKLLLHPTLGRRVYAPLARFCERRFVADRIYALAHAAFLLKGLREAGVARG